LIPEEGAMTREDLSSIVSSYTDSGGRKQDFATTIKVDRSTLWRWLNGKEEIPDWLPDVIEKRINSN